MPHASFGKLLVQAGYITRCQLQSALAFERGWGGRVGLTAALVKLGFLSPSQVSELAPMNGTERQGATAEPANDHGAKPAANEAAKAGTAAAA